mgnify:CR=1 FL=1
MTTYTYHDAYLVKFCTTEREGRAADDVAVLAGSATLSAEWTERLVVVHQHGDLAQLAGEGEGALEVFVFDRRAGVEAQLHGADVVVEPRAV